jgi:hypothetical protein
VIKSLNEVRRDLSQLYDALDQSKISIRKAVVLQKIAGQLIRAEFLRRLYGSGDEIDVTPERRRLR